PSFWRADPEAPGLAARLLTPLGWFYAGAGRLRRGLARPQRAGAPVICVGNLTAGGAGKTPAVLAICERLAALGAAPHILSRGYGGRLRGPHRVDPAQDTAADVGDEPLLCGRRWPVWIGADRRRSADAAVAAGADVLVMDDGFQNPHLHQDLRILVIDAEVGHGNGRVIPAGPLREPIDRGLDRADAAILVGTPPSGRVWPRTPPRGPGLRARITPDASGAALRGRRVCAFAGIGRPEKFFATLGEVGAELVAAEAFPDHYAYNAAMLQRLEARAEALNALLVTTEKDAARFPAWFAGRATVLGVTMGFEDPDAVDGLLARLVGDRGMRRRRRAAGESFSAISP
ncbi:MAG: tetraacyldisaccharide 4'-kinase, partial [Pseudomonadota bacterium]